MTLVWKARFVSGSQLYGNSLETALSETDLNTFGMNKSEDLEPTSMFELINAPRMVKIFQKNTSKLCEKPSQKTWR